MRHNYLNDIGDYAKYALLRAVCAVEPNYVRLGVAWYLTEHAEDNNHGSRRPHLLQDGWRQLDPELLNWMVSVEREIQQGHVRRSLSLLEDSKLFPANSRFAVDPMPGFDVRIRPVDRIANRQAWFARTVELLAGSNFVFVDPDNGLEVPSVSPSASGYSRYTSVKEIGALLQRGSVILYQHCDRSAWSTQLEKVSSRIRAGCEYPVTVQSVRLGASGARGFLCISQTDRDAIIFCEALNLLKCRIEGSENARHFTFLTSETS